MQKRRKIAKKIAYYLFIITVLIILGIFCLGIIFYASGYKVNWKAKKIEKTGMLVITSKQGGFDLFVDGKKTKIKPSRSLNIFESYYKLSMLPGNYNIEIKKEGLKPYAQSIKIEPELVTKVESILLLPEKIPDDVLFEKEIGYYSVSPNGKIVFYQSIDGSFYIFNTEKKEEEKIDIIASNSMLSSLEWDNDSKNILIGIIINEKNNKTFNNYYLVKTENLKDSYNLLDKVSFFPMLEKIFLSPTKKDEFFGLEKDILYKINTNQNTTDKVELGVRNIFSNSDGIYYSNLENNLFRLDTNIYSKEVLLEKFEILDDFEIVSLNGNFFFINNGNFYKIKDKNNLEIIGEDIENLYPEKNKKGIFYTNDFEIWYYDKVKNEKSIITRFSKKIESIQEFYENEYLVYQQGTDINLIKKDGSFNQSINNNIDNIRVFEKDKMLITEKIENKVLFKIINFK